MAEKQIPHPENEPLNNSPSSMEITDEDIRQFNQWADEAAAAAARRTIFTEDHKIPAPRPTPYPTGPEDDRYKPHELSPRVRRNRKIAGGLVTSAVAAGAVLGLVEAARELNEPPQFSQETTIYTVEPGDGIISAAQHIKGIEKIHDIQDAVKHIELDPANIDVLRDGLRPNEQLVIPVSVTQK